MTNLRALTLIVVVAWTSLLLADTATVGRVRIDRLRITDGEAFGGFMVRLDRDLADFGLNCPSRWVTFSCSGLFTTPEIASRMFELAQLAWSEGRRVSLTVDDTKKHDGYCYTSRIDVYP